MRLYQLYCVLNLKPFIKKTPPIQDTLFFPKTLGFQLQAKSKKLGRFMHDQ